MQSEGPTAAPKQVEMTEDDDNRTVTVKDDERTEEQKAEGADVSPKAEEMPVEIEDEEPSEENKIRRVIFETDNWEDCITESVWFGEKIPIKKRTYGRHNKDQKCPVVAFFEDTITLANCKTTLLNIADAYMRASA